MLIEKNTVESSKVKKGRIERSEIPHGAAARKRHAVRRQIEKKIWPEYFAKVKSGEKKFELRLNDFNCNAGDILLLKEWNPKTKQYTGRELKKKVSYVLKTKNQKFWTKKQVEKFGFQILQLE